MGLLLSCFKCGERHGSGSSINLTASCEDGGRRVSSSADISITDSAQAKVSIEVERILPIKGDELRRDSSECMQTDRSNLLARRSASEQLLQVEELEKEIDNLKAKLVQEAAQAASLSNEVRHLRSCSALLDSPNAFREALNALEQALEKGHVEESQPLLYLQSLLSKIEPSEEVIEASLDKGRSPKGLFECTDVSCLVTEKEQKSLEAKQVESDQSQVSMFAPVDIPRESDKGQQLLPSDEQSICNLRKQRLSDGVDIPAYKTPLSTVVKRRSSTSLSFSGFLRVEEVTKERSTSDVAPVSSKQLSVMKIIEKTDLSSENLTEASRSLLAFSRESSPGHSTLTAQSLFGNIEKGFSFSKLDSEVEKPQGNGSFFNLHCSSPTCLWSPQDANNYELFRVSSCLSRKQCQGDTNETSYNGFSDTDVLSHLSTSCSNSMDCISYSSLDSEESDFQHRTEASSSKVIRCQMHMPSAEDKVFAKRYVNTNLTVQADALSHLPISCGNSMDCLSYSSLDSEESDSQHGTGASSSKPLCLMHISSLEDKVFAKRLVNALAPSKDISDASASLEVLDSSTSNEEGFQYRTSSHMTSPSILSLGGEAIAECSPGTTSIWSPDAGTSPYAVCTFSPSRPGEGIKDSDLFSVTRSTPVPRNSHESWLPFANGEARRPPFSPRTPIASLAQVETPSAIHSQGSHSSLDQEKPILGTVAAHWNNSSLASTQKWWDGKGFPNSTNKYKEDQRVSWHATPFEVRLERALANHGRVFQKKLFTGAMATEMEVSM